MTDEEYLKQVLKEQTLEDGGEELANLKWHRGAVERLLKGAFGSGPKLREGGSKAKGTMVKEAYDLDLPYYFARDDESAGETIKEIFENVEKALQKEYRTRRKGVAVRLLDCDQDIDFHIDVAPGRFVDGEDGDAFLYPSTSDKERLQTNLETHVEHVCGSGVIDAIRLQKLWKTRRQIRIKTFALELLVVDLLDGMKSRPLTEQATHVWTEFRDNIDDLSITDPANGNNDLSELLNPEVRQQLKDRARETLSALETSGWEGVFGKLEKNQENAKAAKIDSLRRVALSVPAPAKPWLR